MDCQRHSDFEAAMDLKALVYTATVHLNLDHNADVLMLSEISLSEAFKKANFDELWLRKMALLQIRSKINQELKKVRKERARYE